MFFAPCGTNMAALVKQEAGNYEDAKAQGFPLGSGVIMVFDEAVDLREVLYMLARFFAHESCGKCYPCQMGTQRQMEIIERILRYGGPLPDDKQMLRDIGLAMTQTSLCGLGQTAASAVLSALERWPELFAPAGRANGQTAGGLA